MTILLQEFAFFFSLFYILFLNGKLRLSQQLKELDKFLPIYYCLQGVQKILNLFQLKAHALLNSISLQVMLLLF